MPNTIKTISLTDDDKSYLNKLLTQSTLEIRVYQRARILLLKSEGASNKAIADKLDIGISVVKRCLNKFKENGVEASLRDNKGRGRKAEITDDDITWVNITVRQALPQLSVFLLPHIAQFCFQQLSVTFSVHSTFYHFEPAVSSLYKTIAIVISYRIFNGIQIVFQTFSKTS